MKTLKDVLLAEAPLFLNPQEFGEEITVDGIPALGVWDEQVQPASQFFGASMDVMGVNTVERLLFVMPLDKEEPVPLPVPDQELDIGGQFWMVRDAKDEAGILKLTLYRNES